MPGKNSVDADKRTDQRTASQEDSSDHPAGSFPPFDDPAFSSEPAQPPPAEPANHEKPPKDTQYAGHPEFSQDAAKNKLPPGGFGNSEPVEETEEKARHSEGVNPTPKQQ